MGPAVVKFTVTVLKRLLLEVEADTPDEARLIAARIALGRLLGRDHARVIVRDKTVAVEGCAPAPEVDAMPP